MRASCQFSHPPWAWRWRAALSFLTLFTLWPGPTARAGDLPPIQTVFIILIENHAWSEIQGSPSAPYLNNTLLPMSSYCNQYYGAPGIHPSLPNYLWLEAGTNFGIFEDDDPAIWHQNTTNHLVALLEAAGISWRSYQEDISGTYVPLTGTNNYTPCHNPFVYFDDVTGTNDPNYAYGIAHVRPFQELVTDLANNTVARYNFITPNLCDNMHNPCAPLTNQILQGDNWLMNVVPAILNSSSYSNQGALFITWDETDVIADTRVGMLLLSPCGRGGGYSNSIFYTHGSTLRTMQELFHVGPFLQDAANQTDLSDLFQPTGFRICGIRGLGHNAVELAVSGVTTNAPLILECSTNLTGWFSVSTNIVPQETCSVCVTNGAGCSLGIFYRFMQQLP